MKSALNIKRILYHFAINRRFLISVTNEFVHAFTLEDGSEKSSRHEHLEPILALYSYYDFVRRCTNNFAWGLMDN